MSAMTSKLDTVFGDAWRDRCGTVGSSCDQMSTTGRSGRFMATRTSMDWSAAWISTSDGQSPDRRHSQAPTLAATGSDGSLGPPPPTARSRPRREPIPGESLHPPGPCVSQARGALPSGHTHVAACQQRRRKQELPPITPLCEPVSRRRHRSLSPCPPTPDQHLLSRPRPGVPAPGDRSVTAGGSARFQPRRHRRHSRPSAHLVPRRPTPPAPVPSTQSRPQRVLPRGRVEWGARCRSPGCMPRRRRRSCCRSGRPTPAARCRSRGERGHCAPAGVLRGSILQRSPPGS